MKKIAIILFVFLSPLFAITVDDIIRLHEAGMSNEIIISMILTSSEVPKVNADDVILLQKIGINEKIILLLLKKIEQEKVKENKEEKELSPFDQFFLSTYYSHQYGWPKRNYKNRRQLLEMGVFYRAPLIYPDARYVRIYGFMPSVNKNFPYNYSISPFSMIVPKEVAGQMPQTQDIKKEIEELEALIKKLKK